MAITHSSAVRSVLADAFDAYINTTGSTNPGALLQLKDAGLVVVEFELDNPAFGAAAAGVISGAGLPITAQAEAAGDVDNFVITDRDEATVLSGSVTGVGGGGDIEVTNINIALNQDCSLDSLTYTAAP